jgi:membrane associated rhomboid family serine protease
MWWQFLTAGFAHSWSNLWHLIGNMIGLYIFGRQLESERGAKEVLAFYFTAIVIGTVFWSARNFFFVGPYTASIAGKTVEYWGIALGASGGTTALTILFCLRHPHATLRLYFAIPVPAWAAGALLIASDLFGVQPVDANQKIAFDIHLVGAAFATAYWALGWNFGRLPGMAGLRRMARSFGKSMRPKPDLRVHDPESYYEDLDEEADKLLLKIKREGEQSLTARERRMLEAYSRRMRQKRG